MTEVDETLQERGERYGDFGDHAHLTQELKYVMRCSNRWPSLPSFMKEALEMIAHKISRVLTGDPHYKDSWHDIQGYAKLVEDRVDEEETKEI